MATQSTTEIIKQIDAELRRIGPETLTANELDTMMSCLDSAMRNGAYEVCGENLDKLRNKLSCMSKAARAATGCEEAASQLG